MARIEKSFNFDVGPEWQDLTPDDSGVSPFDRWRSYISVWALIMASTTYPPVSCGTVMRRSGFEIIFQEKSLEIRRGDSLLATLPIHYRNDDVSQNWAFQGRSRPAVS